MAENWRVVWVAVPWGTRFPWLGTMTNGPACGKCRCQVEESTSVLLEHVTSGARIIRCLDCLPPGRPETLVASEALPQLALERAESLLGAARAVLSEGDGPRTADLVHRSGLMLDAGLAILRAEGEPLQCPGDLYQLLWTAPWGAVADRLAVVEFVGLHELTPDPEYDLADYLYLWHRGDPGSLAYWVARVLMIERSMGLEDPQTPLPLGRTELDNG